MNAATRTRALVVSWKDLSRWDLKTARAAAYRLAHPSFRPMGDYIEEATELVRPWEQPDKEWPVYGVTNSGGVFFSHRQKGKDFNAPYKGIKKEWFFHNPTRANVGSLGKVPEVPSDALTSPEYQVWRIRSGLLPEYVEILIHLPFFLGLIDCHRVGAVKERLFTENLMEIPIPSLTEGVQRAVVDRWERAQRNIFDARQRIERLRDEIDSRFFRDLGLTPPEEITRGKCFGVWWKDFQRWSVSYNQAARSGADLSQGKYPVVDLGSVLDLVQYGTSEKANADGDGTPILRINNIKDRGLDLTELKHVRLLPKVREGLLLTDGDILIIRTSGSRDLVGTCGVFHESGEYVFASYLIRLRTAPTKADPDFVSWFLNSPLGRQQVDANSRQIMQNNINSMEISGLQLPLPSVTVQQIVMQRVAEGRSAIAKERAKSRAVGGAVEQEIEEMILGTRPVVGPENPRRRDE